MEDKYIDIGKSNSDKMMFFLFKRRKHNKDIERRHRV